MTRKTYSAFAMLGLLLAAVGAMVVTDVLDLGQFLPPSDEAGLVMLMNDSAVNGDYVATFSKADEKKWQLAGGHKLERFSVDRGDAAFARLTSLNPLDSNTMEWPSQGLSVALPVAFGAKSNGKPIEIGIVARTSQSGQEASLSLVYATRQAGNSGWRRTSISNNFELKKIQYDVPKIEGEYTNPPVLVLNADPTGHGGSVDLLGVYVKILQ